ncbi:hypothetical protein EXE58_15260 [Nocardioides seonyuensis]|uniref:DUF1023 domain-containing protein n=1 Tax=Nocardioides seonyuensis TaxID=2518371 RepID=A0A4P7IH46_9ACTN|nr:alpha/beta hydrolase [Nocardioides seonyuensis]QBX56684.1 hypothetical protein EXE58_15260 [Nocardioides seonyuensis]
MTAIDVPAARSAAPEPEVQPGASAVLVDLRAAAAGADDVASWARAHGAPDDWSGDAAEAAGHAVTRFADDTAAVAAALEKASLAVDAYLTSMAQRRLEHVDLMERRRSLNDDRQELVGRISGATEADVPQLRADAAGLAGRMTAFDADLQAWHDRIRRDEDTCMAALRSVDTVAEGERAATGALVDTAALVERLERLGNDTDAVLAWWNRLSDAQRNALLVSDPDLIGNTHGIPTGDRDEANRASVQRDLELLLGREEAGEELSPEDARWLENARSVEQAIANAERLPYSELDLEVFVMAYQPHAFGGDGVAAVAFGNPDTADHTAVYVPGIMNDGTTIDENSLDALALHNQASAGGSSVATIAWIGYDSPNWNPDGSVLGYGESALDAGHTVTEANAEHGGRLLSQFVDGLNSTHQGGADASHLTVIGHSYGSTTSAHGAADGMDADTLVLIGSPGAGGGVAHVSDLGMHEGQVFVGSAAHDPVTWLGGKDGVLPGTWDDGIGLGEDPSQADFGAHNFEVDPGAAFEGPDGLVEVGLLDNHVSYFEETNPALANMADIVTGQGEDVADTGGRDQDARDHLYDWLGEEAVRQGEQAYDDIIAPVVETFDDLWPGSWP